MGFPIILSTLATLVIAMVVMVGVASADLTRLLSMGACGTSARPGRHGAPRVSPWLVLFVLLATVFMLPGVARAGGVCPNEQLRAENHSVGLPDCRAYELVTPPFKFGQVPITSRAEVAVDGSSIGFNSIGAFGEPPDSSTFLGSAYVASRGGLGWSSLPVDPLASQFWGVSGGNDPEDFSSDLSRTVFRQAPTSSKPIDYRYYIGHPGSAPVEVGPAVPPAKVAAWMQADAEKQDEPNIFYVGATPDLSHVFFRSLRGAESESESDWLWPGDTTVRRYSVYEYRGTGNAEPALVGVKPGPEEAKNRPAEHPALISQCGIVLGGPAAESQGKGSAEDTYNAISESGATVFFTANEGGCEGRNASNEVVIGTGPLVPEVYARVDGSRTVAISQPTKADCEACDTEEAAQRPAAFQGASKDGSKVFFLSEQALLPGAEEDNLYEYDFHAAEGHKVTLLATKLAPHSGAPGGVARVSQDGGLVYFVSEAVLTGAEQNGFGASAQPGGDNLYVIGTVTRHTDFIATLSPGDSEDWKTGDIRQVEATPDGRFLLFASTSDITAEGTKGGAQLYRYDSLAKTLVRITIGEAGFNNNGRGAPFFFFPETGYGTFTLALHQAVAISSDGSKVFFSGPAALTPQALNEACAFERNGSCEAKAANVYEYESGHVYLLSDGQDTHAILHGSAVNLIGASASGSDVFITTADPLVPSDTDTQLDIYDVRVNGGFPAPPAPTGCQGEACQAPAGPAPALTLPSSATLTGPGNLLPPPPATPARPKATGQTTKTKLANALKACKAKHNKHQRALCIARAHKRYPQQAHHTNHTTHREKP